MESFTDPRDELRALLSVTGMSVSRLATGAEIPMQRLCRVLRDTGHLSILEYSTCRTLLRARLPQAQPDGGENARP